jgi:tetratricopeptide (TPR) repeat protein
VSLLMDALKKAEQAKQLGQTDPPLAATRELSLEPEASSDPKASPQAEITPPEAPTSLPKLPKLEDLDEEFLAHARQAPINTRGQPNPPDRAATAATPNNRPTASTSTASPAPSGSNSVPAPAGQARPAGGGQDALSADRHAIRNAFAVKRTPARNHFALAIGALSLLAVAGIGVYFWLQLKPAPSLIVQGRTGGAPARTEDATPRATPAAPTAPAIAQAREASQASAMTLAKAGQAEPASVPPVRKPMRAQQASDGALAASAASPIRITSGGPRINPSAIEGYEAFQAGNLDAARTSYERLLVSEPWNRDALHGLAAIAQREGRTSDTEALYARILEADPRDAQAQAGLLGIRVQRGQGDPVAMESRIKSLLASQPDSTSLQFALGNLYARQNRWSEAQQSYFQALAGDGGNPDYLFNLAVSLDQLHQTKLAGQYYAQALAAAENRPAAFDRRQATGRLNELQR